MTVVVFDPVTFVADFPMFATVATESLDLAFTLATLQIDNTDCSIVPDPPRTMLLYLTTAHVTQLLFGVNGQAPTGIVGRISDATEGSVSVSAAYEVKQESAQWWVQTPFGAAAWQALLPYRSAIYVPSRQGVRSAYRNFALGGIRPWQS